MRLAIFLLMSFLLSCTTVSQNPLELALSSEHKKIKDVFDNLARHELQILYTEIIKDDQGGVSFTDYAFQVDDSLYFYPASTVKFPVALLALEKMNENQMLHRDMKFYVEGDSIESTFTREIEKIFAVSDNEAFNRLFEYLGQDEIDKRLHKKGIPARISHRLSTEDAENPTTKPLIFYINDSTSMATTEIINGPVEKLSMQNLLKGKGHKEGDIILDEPKDFSSKNYLPLTSLHKMMKQLIFPGKFSSDKQFQISENDRSFILNSMKLLPKQAGYTGDEYYDSYGKFLLFGDSKENIPETVTIYNKVGYAYGYLTDCAYIVNKKTKKEYIISATIHVNENGIFNDDHYEYESIGIPFLAELGRQLVLD